MPMMDYSEIAKVLRDEICEGVYADSGSFPSLTKIVQRFGVSRPSAVRSTSIRQPCIDLATTAFRTLLERMGNPDLPPRQILLDTSLVVRESTSVLVDG